MSGWQRCVDAARKVSVEPLIFFIMFGYNVRLFSVQSLLQDRACRLSLGMPANVCDHLEEAHLDLQQTQAIRYGNNLYNGVIMISTLPAIVIATFLGPWGDRYSRKYPLLLSSAGVLVDACLQTVVSALPDAPPSWYLACCTFSGLTGGLIVIFSSTYSYMSDITDERSRQTRFAVLEFFSLMATPTGSLIGGAVYSAYGYVPVMAIGASSMAVGLLWLIFCVRETKPRDPDLSVRQMFRDIFRLDNLRESYRTCVKERPGNLRRQIWLLVVVSFSLRLIHMGSMSIGFSYTRKTFKWGVERNSYTTTLFSLVNGVATVAIVPLLNRRLLVHEAAVGLVGVLSLIAKMTILSVSVFEALIFYAWFCGCMYACGGIALRSRVSKIVKRTELGKVFSLLATCESCAPVLGSALMLQIYNHSVDFFPGMAYAVAAVLLVPSAVIFAWMMHFPSMSLAQFEETEEAKQMKELKNVSGNVF